MNVDRRVFTLNRGLWIGLVCLFCPTGKLLSQDVQPVVVEMISDSVVDQSALNFPDGPFGTCINGQTFQQEAVVSFKGYQYAGYRHGAGNMFNAALHDGHVGAVKSDGAIAATQYKNSF